MDFWDVEKKVMSNKWSSPFFFCLLMVAALQADGAETLKFAEPQFEVNRQSSRFGEVCEIPRSLPTGQKEMSDVVERLPAGGEIQLPTGVENMEEFNIAQEIANRDNEKNAVLLLDQFLSKKNLEMQITKVWTDNSLQIDEFSHGGIRLFSGEDNVHFILKDNSDLLVTPRDCPDPCILSVKTILGRGYLFKGKNAKFEDFPNLFVREFVINRSKYSDGKWRRHLKVEYLSLEPELGWHIRVRWKLGETVELWLNDEGEIIKSKQVMDEGVLSLNFEQKVPDLPNPEQFRISDQKLVLITP